MAKVDREILEEIAADMIESSYGCMDSDSIYDMMERLSDSDLISFLCDM